MTRSRWLVTGVADEPTTTGGGLLRTRMIFSSLAERTGAAVVREPGGRAVLAALLRRPTLIGSQVAVASLLTARAWSILRRVLTPAVLDLYDHPALHDEAIGFRSAHGERARLERGLAQLLTDFPRVLVITDSIADLARVPASRRVLAPNGSDTTRIRPGPFPGRPTVGMLSGAAPGRGIEQLIEAVRAVRTEMPEVRLDMALVPTGAASAVYLRDLRASTAALEWVRITEVPYPRVSDYLAGTSLLAIPHPPHPHLDAALPLKLFDAMAAGRPVVVTPRTETARVVRESNAGVVAASDGVDDLAASLLAVLRDPEGARRMGEAGRRAAVEHYDWRVISDLVADAVLGTGPP